MTIQSDPSAVERLLAGIEAATIPDDVFADDAVLDATVPNWQFSVHGGGTVRDQLAGWFADPGQFDALQRTSLPDGELVEFTLSWTENGVEHTCHRPTSSSWLTGASPATPPSAEDVGPLLS